MRRVQPLLGAARAGPGLPAARTMAMGESRRSTWRICGRSSKLGLAGAGSSWRRARRSPRRAPRASARGMRRDVRRPRGAVKVSRGVRRQRGAAKVSWSGIRPRSGGLLPMGIGTALRFVRRRRMVWASTIWRSWSGARVRRRWSGVRRLLPSIVRFGGRSRRWSAGLRRCSSSTAIGRAVHGAAATKRG